MGIYYVLLYSVFMSICFHVYGRHEILSFLLVYVFLAMGKMENESFFVYESHIENISCMMYCLILFVQKTLYAKASGSERVVPSKVKISFSHENLDKNHGIDYQKI